MYHFPLRIRHRCQWVRIQSCDLYWCQPVCSMSMPESCKSRLLKHATSYVMWCAISYPLSYHGRTWKEYINHMSWSGWTCLVCQEPTKSDTCVDLREKAPCVWPPAKHNYRTSMIPTSTNGPRMDSIRKSGETVRVTEKQYSPTRFTEPVCTDWYVPLLVGTGKLGYKRTG